MENRVIEEPYGFVYITTNLINGKRYVGRCKMKTTRSNSWKYYLGSGHAFKEAVKKYGKENFSRTIISFAFSDEELNDQEIKTIEFLNAVEDKNYYNISSGLYCNPWKNKSLEEQKDIIEKVKNKSRKKVLSPEEYNKYIQSLKIKMTGENNPFYGKHHTEDAKRAMSEKAVIRQEKMKENGTVSKPWLGIKGEDNPHYGKKMSEISKAKMSESAKLKFQNGFVHGKSKPIIIFYNNEKLYFTSINSCFDFLKEKQIISICLDTFKKRIYSNQKFDNFTYEFVNKK